MTTTREGSLEFRVLSALLPRVSWLVSFSLGFLFQSQLMCICFSCPLRARYMYMSAACTHVVFTYSTPSGVRRRVSAVLCRWFLSLTDVVQTLGRSSSDCVAAHHRSYTCTWSEMDLLAMYVFTCVRSRRFNAETIHKKTCDMSGGWRMRGKFV